MQTQNHNYHDKHIIQDIGKNFEFEMEVGIAIKSKKTSS